MPNQTLDEKVYYLFECRRSSKASISSDYTLVINSLEGNNLVSVKDGLTRIMVENFKLYTETAKVLEFQDPVSEEDFMKVFLNGMKDPTSVFFKYRCKIFKLFGIADTEKPVGIASQYN